MTLYQFVSLGAAYSTFCLKVVTFCMCIEFYKKFLISKRGAENSMKYKIIYNLVYFYI